MTSQSHWQQIYESKSPDQQSWHQPRPDVSLDWIDRVVVEAEPNRLVDIGGGASTLVDHLLDRGGVDVSVVDIAPPALEAAKERLGDKADQVEWVVADLSEPLDFDACFDIWHDRAVFHFLLEESDRRAYLDNLDRHLAPDGNVIIATFGPEGPEKCSGLPVQQYSAQSLAETLGRAWTLVDSCEELHTTPWGGEQAFSYARFARTSTQPPAESSSQNGRG